MNREEQWGIMVYFKVLPQNFPGRYKEKQTQTCEVSWVEDFVTIK
jgi:hypothetical protein